MDVYRGDSRVTVAAKVVEITKNETKLYENVQKLRSKRDRTELSEKDVQMSEKVSK